MYKQIKKDNGEISNDVVVRLADKAHIPNDPLNKDWVEYQAWLADGNVPEMAD